MPMQLTHFKTAFNRLNADNLHLLEELYDADVIFQDPIHRLRGLSALRAYYARLYDGVVECRFDFEDEVVDGDRGVLIWVMHVEHARFRKGETLHLPGASHLRFADKVTYHRDYFDMGAFIYERVPVLGSVIRGIKQRL